MIDHVLFLGLALAVSGAALEPRFERTAHIATGSPIVALTGSPAARTNSTTAATDSVAARAPLPDSIFTLPEVRVDRDRTLSAARRRLPTAFVTDLAAGASGHALETLADILVQSAGVRIDEYGGLGSFSTISLRGAPPGHVALYLDGVPITSAAHGVVSLADLPSTAIERVEVYRGLAPLAWGGALPGGAVNLVTAASPGVRDGRYVQGSFGTQEGRATGGLSVGPLAMLLHGALQRSDGDYGFVHDNDTPLNPDDDAASERVNNDFDARTALGSVAVRLPAAFAMRLRGDVFDKRQGLPGRSAFQAREARLAFRRTIGQLEVSRPAASFWPELRLNGALGDERVALRVTETSLGIGRHDSHDRFRQENLGAALLWPELPAGLGLEAGFSQRNERAELRDAADGIPDPPVSRRAGSGAFAALRSSVLEERVTLHAAQRWDRVVDRLRWQNRFSPPGKSDVTRTLETPQLGARVCCPLGLEVRGNWTRTHRLPEFLELFGNQGATQGNPELLPERGEGWDAGLAWSGSLGKTFQATLEGAHYESRTRDLIVFAPNSPNSLKAFNMTRARITGDELSARVQGPAGLACSGSITWQATRDESPIPYWYGKRLPQRPLTQWYARMEWVQGTLRAGADAQYIGPNFLDLYNVQPVASRTLIGASLSFAPFIRQLRVVVEAKNLADHRVSDVGGYPLPGRSVFVSLQARSGASPRP